MSGILPLNCDNLDKDFFCKNDFSTHTYIPVPTESGKMLARNIVKKISGR